MAPPGPNRAWATLLTRASYLPGVLTLAHTLRTHQTAHPLLVLVTPSLPASAVRALELERGLNPLIHIVPTTPLLPPPHHTPTLIAARFEDTWTKLRVFALTDYDALVFLDADIALFRNMDAVFDTPLPTPDWLAATHACVCNLDHDGWAPADWSATNCAFTPVAHPSALTTPTPVPRSDDPALRRTHTLLNGGMFMFHPSPQRWEALIAAFEASPHLSDYMFPDQDFLADHYRDRWRSVGWQHNALKTMRYWHERMWRDGEVAALHYIVDKPWERRVASDGVAGHLGRDGETHTWWWGIWEGWRRGREGEEELLGIVDPLVARPLDGEGDERQCRENREKGLPVKIPAHPGMGEGEGREGVDQAEAREMRETETAAYAQ
ncbi:hypothetical protein MMC15_007784 [Xylographa vitiligo]|nr:hypothetical protein [Xylographa vitiligo]